MDFERARVGRLRAALAAGAVFFAWFGLVRPAIAETTRALCPMTATEDRVPTAGKVLERASGVVATRDPASAVGRPAPHGQRDPDEVSLVPAIFAWDPDVRFVYFRHVSKWM